MLTKNIEVRKLTVNDRSEVAKLDGESRCTVAIFINRPYYYCYGIFDEGKLVGYCMLHMAAECYWIDNLYVTPSERNLGLGSLLTCKTIKETFDCNGKKAVNIRRNAKKFRPFLFSLGITYDINGPCWWESIDDFSYDSVLRYPIGATIELVHGEFMMCPPAGTRGKITSVNKYTVNVDWEGGYDYTINLTADIIRIVDRYNFVNKATKNLLKEK